MNILRIQKITNPCLVTTAITKNIIIIKWKNQDNKNLEQIKEGKLPP